MEVKSQSDFKSFLGRIGVPVVTFVYVLSFFVKLREYTDKLGLKVVVVVAFLVLSIWVVYIWKSKRPSIVDPSTSVRRFGAKVRIVSIFLIVLAVLPVWLAFHAGESFSIPELAIKLVNESNNDVSIHYMGDFFLTVPLTPVMDTQVATGRIRFHRVTRQSLDEQQMVIPARGELVVFAEFLNPFGYRAFLEAGNTALRIVVLQSDGKMLTQEGTPFAKRTLAKGYIVLNTR